MLWLCILAAVVFCVILCARRRGTWRGPVDAIVEAFGRRKMALGITVLGVVGAMAFAMLDWSLLHGSGQWFNAKFGDLWASWASSADMTFGGGYGHIYVLDGGLETAPTIQVLLAPIARIAFNLSFPYPGVVLYPTAFLVVGPLFLGCMALPICAADRWLSYMGVTDLGRRVAVLGTMAVTLPPIALYGHAEDLVALGAMLYGLVASLEGRHRAAGWWLGAALAFQFLAFLAVPIALVLLRRRQWLGAIVRMIVVPLSVMVVPLGERTEIDASADIPPKGLRRLRVHQPDLAPRPGCGQHRSCRRRLERHSRCTDRGAYPSRGSRRRGESRGLGARRAVGSPRVRARARAVFPGTGPGARPHQRVAWSMVATCDHLRRRRVADLVAARPHTGPMASVVASGCSIMRPWMACASPNTAALRRRSEKPAFAQSGTPASGSSAAAGSAGTCGLIHRALHLMGLSDFVRPSRTNEPD